MRLLSGGLTAEERKWRLPHSRNLLRLVKEKGKRIKGQGC